ncbi:outer membrane protein transport protein [Shewanella sp. 202IG2-18]|uniref:outer membrane protein transport protein n=1 Tax=Parashewanella hymeniacidonis TaxID=2807618 RepID=UPI0019612A45|nr:outer membrane protein transport protein [Parashewanella hymeniacidonis]MBM7070958.1 outer membrane protein transport protein [Parashewanella hymeniacidonis]
MKKRILSVAIAALCASTAQVQAAGFQLAEYSATGMGRAFAGEAAIADNASAQGRNPALLTELKGRQISTGAIYVMPNVDVPGSVTIDSALLPVPITLPAGATDVADNAAVPNFYYSNQLNDQLTWGIALNSNYGLATEVSETHASALFGQHTSIKTVEFTPNIAYKLNEQLSIGGGVRIVYGEGELNASMPAWIEPIKAGLPPEVAARLPSAGTSLKSLKGDDVAFGWQLGTTYQLNDNNRIGLAYHSGVKFDLDGTASGALYRNAQGELTKFDGQLPLEIPAFAEFSTFHQLTDKLALHTSINWTQWSVFKELVAHFPNEKPASVVGDTDLVKVENFKNNLRYAIGGTYQINNQWVARAGVALDKTAVRNEYRTTTIPDSDRLWYSVGAGYQASKDLTLDFSATYIKAHGDAPINEEQDIAGLATVHFNGNAEGDVLLLGVQASYKF